MITTFTPTLPLTTSSQQSDTLVSVDFALPSEETLNYILNFSKNLEVKKSIYVSDIELIKS